MAFVEEEWNRKKVKLTRTSVHREFVKSGEGENVVSRCRHCTKVYNTKNPTGLWNHLKQAHMEIHKLCQAEDRNRRENLAAKRGHTDNHKIIRKTQRNMSEKIV